MFVTCLFMKMKTTSAKSGYQMTNIIWRTIFTKDFVQVQGTFRMSVLSIACYVMVRMRKVTPQLDKSWRKKTLRVVWLSEQAYTVDALAIGGDEGRTNLRKAMMSQ